METEILKALSRDAVLKMKNPRITMNPDDLTDMVRKIALRPEEALKVSLHTYMNVPIYTDPLLPRGTFLVSDGVIMKHTAS